MPSAQPVLPLALSRYQGSPLLPVVGPSSTCTVAPSGTIASRFSDRDGPVRTRSPSAGAVSTAFAQLPGAKVAVGAGAGAAGVAAVMAIGGGLLFISRYSATIQPTVPSTSTRAHQ